MVRKFQKFSSSDNTKAARAVFSGINPQTKTADLDPLWSARRIADFFAINISTLRRWITSGSFPEGFWIGKNTRRWRESVVKKFADKKEREALKYAQLV